jgi:hypothetical protein
MSQKTRRRENLKSYPLQDVSPPKFFVHSLSPQLSLMPHVHPIHYPANTMWPVQITNFLMFNILLPTYPLLLEIFSWALSKHL